MRGLGTVNGARDNLYRVALANQATEAGSAITEYDAQLSEFQSNARANQSTLQSIGELSKLFEDAGQGDSEKLAARQNMNNALISANVMYQGTANDGTKKQIQSWIAVVAAYIFE